MTSCCMALAMSALAALLLALLLSPLLADEGALPLLLLENVTSLLPGPRGLAMPAAAAEEA